MVRNTTQRDQSGTQRRCTLRHRLKLCCDTAGAVWMLAIGSAHDARIKPISVSDVPASHSVICFNYSKPGKVFPIRRATCHAALTLKGFLEGFDFARKPILFFIFCQLILSRALPAGASIISFSDDTFTPSNWSLTTQTIGLGGDASAIQQSSGGDPGAYRQITIDVVGSSDSEVYAFNLKNGATVTPASSGAIISLTYIEARNTTGQEFGPAIQQGSNLYYAYAGSGGTSGWQSTTMTFSAGAPTNNLLTSFRTDTNASAHPDFSATGSPMTFGFVGIDNSVSKSFTAVSGYDNWSISVTASNSVPEPANIGVLILTTWALMRRPRRSA